ncbi:MAG: GTPase HflX [Rhodospirillales bacterium]
MTEQGASAVKAALICPLLASQRGKEPALRSDAARAEEAAGLVRAIGLEVVLQSLPVVQRPTPATLLGRGQVESLGQELHDADVMVAIVDGALSPIQQRNLERDWGCKVIDRTGLILEIFGARAQTREGQMQVERAALSYQRSRLVRSWTHLERQRGGFGFLGGPGESQLEIDRRLIAERIERIDRDLAKVGRTRAEQRKGRALPVVALVGYTNAGKSTLFNRLTEAGVMAQDLLFATLDPTMRRVTLPSGREFVLSDTVGFISDLPTQLVAAFRATLEEVVEADLILHVRDCAHPDSEAQRQDVEAVLAALGCGPESEARILEVLNKADCLNAETRRALEDLAGAEDRHLVSALTGSGIGDLLVRLEAELGREEALLQVDLESSDGKLLAWLHAEGQVLSRRDDGEGHLSLDVRLDAAALGRLRQEAASSEGRLRLSPLQAH